jgi:hypothetical protein
VWLINTKSPVGGILRTADAAVEYKYAGSPERHRIGLRRENEPFFAAYPELK